MYGKLVRLIFKGLNVFVKMLIGYIYMFGCQIKALIKVCFVSKFNCSWDMGSVLFGVFYTVVSVVFWISTLAVNFNLHLISSSLL